MGFNVYTSDSAKERRGARQVHEDAQTGAVGRAEGRRARHSFKAADLNAELCSLRKEDDDELKQIYSNTRSITSRQKMCVNLQIGVHASIPLEH